jgi:hypothetical protein
MNQNIQDLHEMNETNFNKHLNKNSYNQSNTLPILDQIDLSYLTNITINQNLTVDQLINNRIDEIISKSQKNSFKISNNIIIDAETLRTNKRKERKDKNIKRNNNYDFKNDPVKAF